MQESNSPCKLLRGPFDNTPVSITNHRLAQLLQRNSIQAKRHTSKTCVPKIHAKNPA
jgi:hypothetical protein